MKKILKKLPLLLPVLMLVWATTVQASSLTAPVSNISVPGKAWSIKPPDKKDGTQKIFHPTKIGQAVNIRIHTYDVPVSARAFIEQVRGKIMKKPDYEGAEIQLIKDKVVKGKSWVYFGIKRRDEINQEIWGIKPSKNVVLMIIYTGAGDYFSEYYGALKKIIKEAS